VHPSCQTLGVMNEPLHINLRNRWRIPITLASEVASRDLLCVYCRGVFSTRSGLYSRRASWEHIVNDLEIVTLENIAVSCVGCNASKGRKSLSAWLESPYCYSRGIGIRTLAPVAAAALQREETDIQSARERESLTFSGSGETP
jgi:hypothetical protein